ncbi:MAG: hypothetical protein CL878_10825 [Dehalococcoidia bacterium]|nr:hypothetical protein [Dehalococcoidia bacterium]
MEFRRYVDILIRSWLLIVLCGLAGLAGAYTYGIQAPRLYRATAALSVTPSVIEYWTGQAVERLLNNYTLRLKSGAFLDRVTQDLVEQQHSIAVGEVAGKVQAIASGSEFRIAIQVDDANAQRAQVIVNAVAERFVREMTAENFAREKRDIDVTLLDRAGVPSAPFSPRPRRAAAAGLILGAMVGLLGGVLLEYWRDTVQGAEEVTDLLGLAIIGVLPTVRTPRTGWRRWMPGRAASTLTPHIGVASDRS